MDPIQLSDKIKETIVRSYSYFTFSISRIVPNTCIDVNIVVYADDQTAKNFTVNISGEEYTNWLEDDNYLIELLKEKIAQFFS